MIYLLVKSLLLPPGLFIVLATVICLLMGSCPRVARSLLILEIVLIYWLSTVYVLMLAARYIEPPAALQLSELPTFQPQAIVVLGTTRARAAPEYSGRDTVGADLLLRLRYTAKLWRETQLPVLVAGGPGYDNREPEAELMARTLDRAFKVPVEWRETKSLTTWENALFSEQILRASGVERVVLVTQAYHMPRAVDSFERVGLTVLPAPTGFIRGDESTPLSYSMFLPSMGALTTNTRLLHEWLGSAYYRWRFY